MGVRIDAAGNYKFARCVEDAVGVKIEPGSDKAYSVAIDKDIAVVIIHGGNDPAILDQRFH